VNLAGIRAVVQVMKNIPVIGNGDVITPQAAKKMLDDTGCAGVSIGRGAFYNPWIFQHTLEYLQSFRRGEFHEPQNAQTPVAADVSPLLFQKIWKGIMSRLTSAATKKGTANPSRTQLCRAGAGDVPASGLDD